MFGVGAMDVGVGLLVTQYRSGALVLITSTSQQANVVVEFKRLGLREPNPGLPGLARICIFNSGRVGLMGRKLHHIADMFMQP